MIQLTINKSYKAADRVRLFHYYRTNKHMPRKHILGTCVTSTPSNRLVFPLLTEQVFHWDWVSPVALLKQHGSLSAREQKETLSDLC